MASDVKIRFRSFLPGAGHDGSGNAKQGKSNVRGEINVTSYARGGETLTPQDVGLTTIDDIVLTPKEAAGGANPAQGARRALYSHAAQQFYVLENVNATGVENEAASAAAINIRFDAFGDSAHDVELL